MGRPRSFDYSEAQALRAQGLSYREIGERLGVSGNSVARACDPAYRRRQSESARRVTEGYRDPCRGGCGVLVTYRGLKPSTGYCIDCWHERVRFAAEMRDNHGTESRYRLGCRCLACRRAASEAKRRRREQSRVPCATCGTPVNSINRRFPDKPPECRPCAMRRIHEERKRVAA
jgi:hypothetical protein